MQDLARSSPRVLLAARYVPPIVSGGSARPLMLAQALQALGCEVTVAAPVELAGFPTLRVPHPNAEPPPVAGAGGGSLRDRVRRAVLWPDTDVRWSSRLWRAVVDARQAWDVVLTTSPPESLHLVGDSARRTGLARWWIADFRDGWQTSLRRRRDGDSTLARLVEGVILRHWLRRCDAALCVNAAISAELAEVFPASRHHILPHLPPELDAAAELPPLRRSPDEISLVHTGSFSLSEPTTSLASVLDRLAPAFAAAPRLHLHLFGRLSAEETGTVEQADWRGRITRHGLVAPDLARAAQRAADILLVVNADALDYPPGKFTECLASGRPLLAVGHPGWADAVNDGEGVADRLQRLARSGRAPDGTIASLSGLRAATLDRLHMALGPFAPVSAAQGQGPAELP